jgi:hypothetical protein
MDGTGSTFTATPDRVLVSPGAGGRFPCLAIDTLADEGVIEYIHGAKKYLSP